MRPWLLHALVAIAACAAAHAQQAGDSRAANPLARLELEELAETLRRPLFSATRRPPPPPAPIRHETPPPAPPEPPALTLVGVVADQRGMRAFVKSGTPAKTRSLSWGDDVDGWKVVEIAARRIVLEREARKFTIALFARRSLHSKIAATPTRSSSGD